MSAWARFTNIERKKKIISPHFSHLRKESPMFDKLEEKLNDLFPSFDKYGNKRGPLENYVVGSSVSVIALAFNTLMFIGLLAFSEPNTTAHTIAIATVVSSTLIILCSWVDAIASIKSHRKNADYHRAYMRKAKERQRAYE